MSKTEKYISVPEIVRAFPLLNEREFRLLGFCAFYGSYPPNPWTVTMYDAKFGLPKNRSDKDRKTLRERGFLGESSVSPADYFRIVVPLIRHFPDWVTAFEEVGKYRSDETAFLWKVAKCLAAGDTGAARNLPYPKSTGIWKFFTPLVKDGDEEVLGILPQPEAAKILENLLLEALMNETLSADTIAPVRRMAEEWLDRPDRVLDRCDAYTYYLTGVQPGDDDRDPSFWRIGIRAADELIKGRLPEALDAFQRATELVPEGNDGVFPDRILTWLYTLGLLRARRKYNGSRDERILTRLSRSSGFRYVIPHAPTQTLLTHIESADRNCPGLVKDELLRFLSRDNTVIGRRFAQMVAAYFRLGENALAELGLQGSDLSPLPILRNERCALFPAPSAEKERLKEIFGGPGVIGTVPRKETWEMALTDLSDFVSFSQEGGSLEKRIIYFVDEKWITAILEQSRAAGAEVWTKERLLSRSTFLAGGYDSMDMTDLKLARAIASKAVDVPDIDVLIPIMAGTDRVFTGQHFRQPYTPLPIENGTPFVAFTGKGGTIEVTSNVQRLQDGTVPPVSVYRNAGTYTCIHTNPIQRDIIGKLLSVGSFPATALPAVKRTIESLKDILEVRSSLGGTAIIPTLRGSARLDLRITPIPDDDQGYQMDILAAPYEEGDLRCEPGRGEEDVYDDTGGEPRFIRRDLQAEYDNYYELRDHLEEGLQLDFYENPDQCYIYDSASLLGVLTWAYDHRDKCFVEWPEGRSLRFRGDLTGGDVDITVSTGINWFEVEGEVRIGKDKYNLAEILKGIRASEIKGFIKLGDRDYVRMTQTLQKHLQAVDDMMSGHAGKNRVVPVYRVGHLAQVLGEEGGLHGTMDEGFKNLLATMQSAYDTTPEVPGALKATLRDYQKEGYVWMKRLDAWGAGACLADDTRDLLEEFAEGLMSSRELTMEDAMEKMEQFLRHYFFTMIQRKSSPDKGADPIGRAGESDLHPSGHFLTASKSDIAGITVGDNLSSVLPSEIALLGSPVTLHGIRRGTDAAVDIYCLHHIFIYPVISDFFHAGRGNSPFSRKIAILRYEKISPDPAASRRLPPSGFREGTP